MDRIQRLVVISQSSELSLWVVEMAERYSTLDPFNRQIGTIRAIRA